VKSDDVLASEQALEAKFAEIGFGKDRIDVRAEAAPEEGTPAETVQAEPLRDEQGRFVSAEPQVEAPTDPENASDSGDDLNQQGNTDPAVAAFLAKYGGDVDKALAGAVHLQRKAGEQSNEVGELRQMVQELSQIRESFQTQQQQTPQVLDQATVDWFDEQAYSNPHGAAEYARQQGNDVLLQRALAIWKANEPGDYAVYVNDLNNQKLRSEFEERLQQAQQLPMDSNMHMALMNVRSSHPEFSNYDEALEATLQKYPSVSDAIQSAATSGDRNKLEAAIETAYALAQGDTLRSLALTGPAPDNTTTTSQVVELTVSETTEAAPEPSNMDKFRSEFHQEMEQRRRGVFVAE